MALKLYVGNLSYKTTEEELTSHFSTAGGVRSVKLVTDRFSGQSRGFAFVEMATEEDAQKAIEQLNGKDLGGRQLVVNEAHSSPSQGGSEDRRPGGGGRFGRRGGGGFRGSRDREGGSSD